MAEMMEREMDLSDGEETKGVAHIPATFVPPSHAPVFNRATVLASQGIGASALEIGIEGEYNEQLPGYIFLCNGKTKPECFRYRVFGLPKGRKDIAEKIKPGMKLFLYDFEKKLLYGIYEATIGGKLYIEPDAFEKKYPAQVGFRIFKNCYPLPENALKSAIHENYKGAKFKQELSPRQVATLLSLFRSFTAPELDSVPQGLGSRSAAPGTLSFEERFIASSKFRLASSVLDPLSVRHADPRHYSHMAHQPFARDASSIRHSYPRQSNYTNPLREPLSLSGLNKPYNPTETRQQHMFGDPQLKYLTILSNIRRYGTDPERVATETEYHPASSLGNEHYASTYSVNGYRPSALSGYEHSSASAANENVYYPSTSSANEFYASTSQKEGETNQTSEIPAANYYHQQGSTASDATVSVQLDAQAVHAGQSHTETSGYPPVAHGQEVGSGPQPPADALGYAHQPHSTLGYTLQSAPQPPADAIGYAHQPQSLPLGYTTHPHQGSVEDNGQSYAGATGYTAYTQQQYIGATEYAPQTYASATGYAQPYAAAYGYAPQMHAEPVGYTQQAAGPQSALPGASGTVDWNPNQSYPGTADWSAVNQSYYPYTADTSTSYNQTS